ncbi:hypothetical protein NYQ43_14295 [Xanthomonas translucens pv. translucens]|uniref:hypothetical protein n=1 Tax=Xanthomonas campestris pv. translucens TaxID=343 RepID=UPI001F29DAA6|nr:hypothetical protein [Xanthomonas translucens]MCT8286838.1 hypothetical protein [Xanthomonas translucens pv. translucens]MCT8304496.1 hypothetical protein [Xanthomonas translucens pv. translucens]UII63921.1 hypothetical protein LV507_18885 [Xanthomonas translucens]
MPIARASLSLFLQRRKVSQSSARIVRNPAENAWFFAIFANAESWLSGMPQRLERGLR